MVVKGQSRVDSLRSLLNKESSSLQRAATLEELCFEFFLATLPDSLPVYQMQLENTATKLNHSQFKLLSSVYKVQSFYFSDTAKFSKLSSAALVEIEESNCSECLAMLYLGLGLRDRKANRFVASIKKMEQGFQAIEGQESKRILRIRSILLIATAASYHNLGKHSEALQAGLDAMRIVNLSNDVSLRQKVYTILSVVNAELASSSNKYGSQADRDRYKILAKQYMIKAYQNSLLLPNRKTSGFAALNLSTYYHLEEKNVDSSIYYANQAIRIGHQTNQLNMLSSAYNLKATNLTNSKPDSALYYADKAIEFGKNVDELRPMLTKAKILRARKSISQSFRLAEQALDLSMKSEQLAMRMELYEFLAELNQASGNISKSYFFYKKYIALRDSIISKENYARIEELKTKYETEIKDKEIKNLEQKSVLQTLEIKQKNLWLVGTLLTTVLIASILFLYFRQRTLNQQQKILSVENKFLRFQLDPHFLSNALVSIQRFMLDNNATQASSYLTKFSKLMRQLLEYSREEFITIEEEIDLLRNYLDIQKLRLKDKFEYEINVDSKLAIGDSRIPPMFAQPFVENAIEHGIGHRKHGKISISFSEQGNQLLLEIQDDGAGISETSVYGHKSLSTTIIKERIALLNKSGKKPIQLQIGNVPGANGTRVVLTLPIYS